MDTSPSLLTGLLFDGRGNRFTPSHSAKEGRRYRYYVSQAVIRNRKNVSQGTTRLPAQEIEDLVLSRLQSFLGSAQRLIDSLGGSSIEPWEIEQFVETARECAIASPDKVRGALPAITKQVILREGAIELHLGRQALRRLLLGIVADADASATASNLGDALLVQEQVALKRYGGEVRLMLPPDVASEKSQPVPSLVRAMARAHSWVDQILRGEVPNQQTIAEQTGLDKRYVSRLMPLAFLAPDIVETILEGKQPLHLSLDTCLKDLPVTWVQQRADLLFAK